MPTSPPMEKKIDAGRETYETDVPPRIGEAPNGLTVPQSIPPRGGGGGPNLASLASV